MRKLLLKSGARELLLERLEGGLASAAELGHALDEIAKLGALLASSSGVLTLGASTAGLPSGTAASNSLRFLVRRFSFECMKLHAIYGERSRTIYLEL